MLEHLNIAELLVRQKILATFFIIIFALLTIEFIRRRALMERYAILWLVAAFVLVPLVLSMDLVNAISRFVGIAYPPLTILLTAVLFIVLMLFHFSVALSQSRRNESRLVLRLVEQEERISKLEEKVAELNGAANDARPSDTDPRTD